VKQQRDLFFCIAIDFDFIVVAAAILCSGSSFAFQRDWKRGVAFSLARHSFDRRKILHSGTNVPWRVLLICVSCPHHDDDYYCNWPAAH
jgi:hypothetical protein